MILRVDERCKRRYVQYSAIETKCYFGVKFLENTWNVETTSLSTRIRREQMNKTTTRAHDKASQVD